MTINLEMSIHEAALIREFLFRHTKQDSYEFPGQRTIIIRNFIHNLDVEIEKELNDSQRD